MRYFKSNGIVFVLERGSEVIFFVDFLGCLMVKVDLVKKWVDVICYFEKYNLL